MTTYAALQLLHKNMREFNAYAATLDKRRYRTAQQADAATREMLALQAQIEDLTGRIDSPETALKYVGIANRLIRTFLARQRRKRFFRFL